VALFLKQMFARVDRELHHLCDPHEAERDHPQDQLSTDYGGVVNRDLAKTYLSKRRLR
jgi:hypothetical protein